ncbi:MAG TPA: uracil-DNA glycosylase family protein [Sphingomonas sp.]|nr:uracil-DNA glycosylase family protein [Sphingomonas sp.]
MDTLVDEHPRNWLAPVPTTSIAPLVVAEPRKQGLPETLNAFRQWLLADASVPGNVSGRVDAAGDHETGTIIVVDMPETGDRTSGALLSGEVGALFDRMLGAIGLARDKIYLIPFAPARPTSGRVGDADLAALTPLLRHHLALASPKRLLLLGDAPTQALLCLSAAQARETVHSVEIAGRTVQTIASIHPRLVNLKRDYRPLAWADLQRFAAL